MYQKLVEEVSYILQGCITKEKLKIHSLKSRDTGIKTFESFFNKIERENISNNFCNEVEDIAGIRVICLFRSDLKIFSQLINDNFQVIRTDTSRTKTEMPFGYASDHYIVKLSKDLKGPRYDNIKNLKCEIQIRTILMDAWASISHHLDYKQEIDIPLDLRANFNALAGVFYVADTSFEYFKKGVEEARKLLMVSIQKNEFDINQEINLESLSAYFKWKFPERIPKLEFSDVSQIILELRNCGYHKLKQLDDKIKQILPILKEQESEAYNLEKWEPRWTPEGLIRNVLDLTNNEYFKRPMPSKVRNLKRKYRKKLG